jgi:hypothetical protein
MPSLEVSQLASKHPGMRKTVPVMPSRKTFVEAAGSQSLAPQRVLTVA